MAAGGPSVVSGGARASGTPALAPGRSGVRRHLVPPTLRGYRRSWLRADLLAGLALVAVALPAQMATAQLAGLPAVDGLYAFVAASLAYALLGPNRHLCVGADSTIAPVLAAGAASLAAVGTPRYAAGMEIITLLVGGVLVAVGLLRLGWVAELLSTPVITGVLGGIAVQIAVRQLPTLLGLPAGGTTTVGRLRSAVHEWAHVNGWTLAVGLGVLAVILGAHRLSHRAPGALAGLVLSLLAADALGLSIHHHVAVLGVIHGGLPHLRSPTTSWAQLRRLPSPVLTVALVCVAQTAATVRTSADGTPAAQEFNRDLIAVGAGSLLAAGVGGFAVDASPPNTAVVSDSGSRSQLASLVAAAVIVVVAVAATAPLRHLPEATLAATLLFVSSRLLRLGELRRIARYARIEFALAAGTLVVVALSGIETGVLVAVLLSIADRTRRSARPRDVVLGRETGSDHWVPVDVGLRTEQVPGVLVYLVYAPIWYGNADYVKLRIHHLLDVSATLVHAVVLDADGISDVDYTGLQALRALAAELDARSVSLVIARASHLVHHDLKHGALLDQMSDRLFASVEQAVSAVRRPGADGAGPEAP